MSIVRKDSAGSQLSSFSGFEQEFDLSFAPKNIVEVKATNIVKKKKDEIVKKKQKKFYELLEESYDKGIFNQSHSHKQDRNTIELKTLQNTYSCPVICVAELLGWIPPYDGLEMDHYELAFIMEKEGICKPRSAKSKGYNEAMYAQYLAEFKEHNNRKVAAILKRELYDTR